MNAPPYLWVYLVFSSLTITGLVLLGINTALERSGTVPARRRQIVRSTALLLSAWLGLSMVLGALGVFQAGGDHKVPWIAFAVTIPIILGTRMISRSTAMQEILRAVPQSWLIGLQAYRGLGSIFLVLFGLNLLPGVFALPAGFGDTLVGVAAIPVAAYYASRRQGRDGLVVAWNVLGIADLVIALTAGFLSAPGPLQQLSLSQPNYLVGEYPLVLIPVFAVPLSIVLHAASLSKVRWSHARQAVPAVA